MIKAAVQYIEENFDEMVELWRKLVNLDSCTCSKEGIDLIVNLLAQEFDKEDIKTKIVPFEQAGNTLIAKMEGRSKEKLILLGHVDSVFIKGTTTKRTFNIVGDKAYGPGVLDMKGGIVQILYTCRALRSIGWDNRSIQVILVGDEENGHKYSKCSELLMGETKGCVAAFCCESGQENGNLVTDRKGVGYVKITVKGKAVHAGNEPEKGSNAIQELSIKLLDIKNIENSNKETTINLGIIRGGNAINVVAEEAFAELDIRFLENKEYQRVLRSIADIINKPTIAGTRCYMEERTSYPPMNMTEGSKVLLGHFKKVALDLGQGEIESCKVGGGADSSIISSMGVPVICGMGPRGANNHSPDEYAYVSSLKDRTKLLTAGIMSLA